MHKLIALVFAASLLVCSTSLTAAQGPSSPISFHEVGELMDYTVVPWGQPLAGGAVRVLAIAPFGTMGDIASLRAYLEIELETVALWDRDHLGFDPQFPDAAFPEASYEAVEKRLLHQLEKKRHDVIIVGQSDPSIFPDAVQQKLIEHAEAGTGLILTGPGVRPDSLLGNWLHGLPRADESPDFSDGVGPLGIPEEDQSNLATFRIATNGRVVQLAFQNAPSPRHCLIPIPQNPFDMVEEYEANAFSLVCKSVIWAARRESPIAVSHLVDATPKGPDDEEIPPGYPAEFIESIRKNAFSQPIRPFILQLTAPATESCEVAYQVRLPGISLPALITTPKVELPRGASYFPLDLLIGAPGNYLIDVWIRNRKGVVTWHTESLEIPGWPEARNVTVSQDGKKAVWLHPNDHLDISASIASVAAMTASEGATVVAQAVDSYGRRVARASQPLSASGGTATLRLELADLFAPLVRVDVVAVPSALAEDPVLVNQAARTVFYFPVRLPDPARVSEVIISAEGPFDYGAIRQLKRLRRNLGVDALHAPLNADSLLAAGRSSLSRIAQLGTLDEGRVGPGPVRIPCLSDPEFQKTESQSVASGVLEAWAGGAPTYSLGAGCALTSSESGVCQSPACLARFQLYLQQLYPNLNALNETWGSHYSAWEDVTPEPLDQCQQRRVWAPWLDFRRSMDSVFAEAQGRGRNAVHSVDGSGRVGFQTLPDHITPMTGYDWRLLCQATDFLTVPPEPVAMRRLQSYDDSSPGSGIVLGNINVRARPVQARWGVWNSLFHQLPAVWLDTPFDGGARSLYNPVGAPEPGVAALGESLSQIEAGAGALILNAAVHPSGIAFVDSPATRYLDYADPNVVRSNTASEQWLGETINRLGFPAGVRSLETGDPQGLDGINTLLLSCVRILSDQEIAALKSFHENNGLIVSDGRPGELDGHGARRTSAALPFLHPLNPTQPEETAAIWTNRPVWVNQLATDGASDEDLLSGLLARAGNEPFLAIQLPEKQQGAVARFQFYYGAATLAAFLPDPELKSALRSTSMKLPDKHFAIDLLHPASTAPRGRIQWTASPGEPALFAILPYRVDGLIAEVPERIVAGQRIVVRMLLDTGDTAPGSHLILLRVEGPDGEERMHYRQFVPMEGGIAETFVPMAENDAPGIYSLQLTDILSQTQVSYAVDVES